MRHLSAHLRLFCLFLLRFFFSLCLLHSTQNSIFLISSFKVHFSFTNFLTHVATVNLVRTFFDLFDDSFFLLRWIIKLMEYICATVCSLCEHTAQTSSIWMNSLPLFAFFSFAFIFLDDDDDRHHY